MSKTPPDPYSCLRSMPSAAAHDLPSLVDILISRSATPMIVADADDPNLVVAAVSDQASLMVDSAESTMTLVDWLGSATIDEVHADLARKQYAGVAGAWRWELTSVASRRWLLCELLKAEPPHALSSEAIDRDHRRLMAMHEAVHAVNSDLDLGLVLQRIVDVARQVVPARYAALGVSDQAGKIEQFITSGLSAAQRAAIGPLPAGHGLLGALIHEGRPLRVTDIGSDPRSSGIPPHHPPMQTLLGVPIKLNEDVLGDLYLTDRLSGTPFTDEDLEAVKFLASHAARAIERARLYEVIRRERQRAEAQRDQLQAVVDNLPSAVIIVVPPDGTVELANSAAYHLIRGEDRSERNVIARVSDFALFQADGLPLPHAERPGIQALGGLVVRNRQLLVAGPVDRRIPVLVQATPLVDVHGQVTRAVLVFQDITRLREAEQLKDDFLSLISHEFRTPLTAIHGGAHLLTHHALDDDTRQELLSDVVLESERLDRMLGNILSLAAIMAGRLAAATEPVLVAPLVRKIVDEVGARSPMHQFVVDLPRDLPPLEGDPDLLGQVLRNLYENAVKYAPAGGEIRTYAEADSVGVTIHIRDQGVGIAPEHVGEVFERFRRAGTDPTVRGMGLGLYLSRNLMEAQGGTIRADSPGPGRGATFSVELPIAREWIATAADHQE